MSNLVDHSQNGGTGLTFHFMVETPKPQGSYHSTLLLGIPDGAFLPLYTYCAQDNLLFKGHCSNRGQLQRPVLLIAKVESEGDLCLLQLTTQVQGMAQVVHQASFQQGAD